MPPVKPMLAKAVAAMPEAGDGELLFEPKWDGFRCIVFRDGDEVELGSRNERPLTRYFPELLDPLRASLPLRCVVDGEIVVAGPEGLDFEALQQRIHPAASRINRLAIETAASFVAFDLLALDDRSLLEEPFVERRRRLVDVVGDEPRVRLTPSTTKRAVAEDWFTRFEGAGLDGVIAKPAAGTYVQDKRVQFKLKHKRTADCVVAAFRWHKDGNGVGSLLLGIYDDDGRLHHMGVASSFTAARRRELVDELSPFLAEDLSGHPWAGWAEASAHEGSAGGRLPGAPSRWNASKDLSFVPLRPELVAEVEYERVDAGRFRHSARLRHWRADRDPASCTFDQLEAATPLALEAVFDATSGG